MNWVGSQGARNPQPLDRRPTSSCTLADMGGSDEVRGRDHVGEFVLQVGSGHPSHIVAVDNAAAKGRAIDRQGGIVEDAAGLAHPAGDLHGDAGGHVLGVDEGTLGNRIGSALRGG